jgi:hypothetical protein
MEDRTIDRQAASAPANTNLEKTEMATEEQFGDPPNSDEIKAAEERAVKSFVALERAELEFGFEFGRNMIDLRNKKKVAGEARLDGLSKKARNRIRTGQQVDEQSEGEGNSPRQKGKGGTFEGGTAGFDRRKILHQLGAAGQGAKRSFRLRSHPQKLSARERAFYRGVDQVDRKDGIQT